LSRATAIACALLLLPGYALPAQPDRQVAITIDDLPRGGDGGPYDAASVAAMTTQLLRPFRDAHIPLIGFVNAGRNLSDAAALRGILDLWLDAGADLGNHSFTHPDLNTVPLERYVADIERGEPAVREALAARGKRLEYYRHPYLRVGATPEVKRGLQVWLDAHGYRVAPVTLDDADYMYAALYPKAQLRERVRAGYVPYMESVVEFFERRSIEVFDREIPQVLLIHASQMNADLMPQLLAMFRQRGYRFVTLAEALRDPAYRAKEDYVGRGGFSWIHRWSRSRGMAPKGEPEPPDWVSKGFETQQ
jgi:peptidoglycan/xylan/chitin deacetylase (PgdA/CDA1 family)